MTTQTVLNSARIINFFPLILIVEEDADTRLMLKYLLEIWKYRVLEAKNSVEAVRTAAAYRPDLALININLPALEGLETGRRIRAIEGMERSAVVFVSATANENMRAAAGICGDDFLAKPIDFALLETALETHLKSDCQTVKSFPEKKYANRYA